jgi:hypothetical protein
VTRLKNEKHWLCVVFWEVKNWYVKQISDLIIKTDQAAMQNSFQIRVKIENKINCN